MATVIRGGEIVAALRGSRSLELVDYLDQARALLHQSRCDADRIVEEARREADGLRAEATRLGKAEGYAQGYDEGLRAGNQSGFQQSRAEAQSRYESELGTLIAGLTSALGQLESRKREFLIQAKRDVLHLAVEIAEKVTHQIGLLDRRVAESNVAEAISLLSPRSDVKIRIHPKDSAGLSEFAGSLKDVVQALHHVQIVADESVPPGGCIVASPITQVDARLETQLEEISRLLLGDEARSHGAVGGLTGKQIHNLSNP